MASYRQSAFRGVAALAIGSALALGACGDTSELPESVALIDVDGVKAKAIAKRFSPKVTTVSEAEMKAALELMKASEPAMSWDSETFGKNSVTLTNADVSGMTTETMVFHGLRRAEDDGLKGVAYDRFEARNIEIDFETYTETLEEALGEETLFGMPEDELEMMDVPPPVLPGRDVPVIEIAPPSLPPSQDSVDDGVGDDLFESMDDRDDVELPDIIVSETRERSKPARLRIASLYTVEGMSPAGEGALDEMKTMMESGQLTGLPGEMGPVALSGLELLDAEGTAMATLESLAFADSESGTRNGFFDMDGLDISWDEEGTAQTLSMEETSVAGFPALEPMMDAFMQFSSRASAMSWRSEMPEGAPIAFNREAVLAGFLLPYEKLAMKNLRYAGEFELVVPELSFTGKRKGDKITADTRMSAIMDMSEAEANMRDEFVDAVGDDTLSFDLAYNTRMDVAADTMLQTGQASVPDGFSLDYTYGANGYVVLVELYADMMEAMMTSDDPELAVQNMAMQSFAILDAYRIDKLDFAFTDEGMYGRLTDRAAEEEGVDPDTYRREIAAGLRAQAADGMASSPIPAAIVEDVLDALAEFIIQPGSTFRLTIDPEDPVTMIGLMSLSKERLGFSAETTR